MSGIINGLNSTTRIIQSTPSGTPLNTVHGTNFSENLMSTGWTSTGLEATIPHLHQSNAKVLISFTLQYGFYSSSLQSASLLARAYEDVGGSGSDTAIDDSQVMTFQWSIPANSWRTNTLTNSGYLRQVTNTKGQSYKVEIYGSIPAGGGYANVSHGGDYNDTRNQITLIEVQV